MAKRVRLRLFLAVSVGSTFAALPALASAGTIAGTVTEASSGNPLGGVKVCSHVDPYTFEDTCTTTDGAGSYALAPLPAGSYAIQFDDSAANRNVVSQYYGGLTYPGTRVQLASASETRTGIDVALQEGSTIEGTVTDAAGGEPLAGIPACAYAEDPVTHNLHGRCESSGPGGTYVIRGLAPGKYEVEFQSGFLNYQAQRYDGKVWPEPPDRVEITGPGEVESGIDAKMRVGVEITGRVTEAGTGNPLPRISVELLFVGREGNGLAQTGPNGEFRIWGQPEGEYLILFSKPDGPFGSDTDCYAAQYYRGSASAAGATVLHGVPGTPITGIDAQLVRTCPPPGPPPLQVSFTPVASKPKSRKLHCRKGFQKKRVKGKARCVRHHKHHHHHRRRHR